MPVLTFIKTRRKTIVEQVADLDKRMWGKGHAPWEGSNESISSATESSETESDVTEEKQRKIPGSVKPKMQ